MKSDEDRSPKVTRRQVGTAKSSTDHDVTRTAVSVMALLKNDKKKALQQVKHLVKLNKDVAHQVFTADVCGWTPVHACALRGSKKLLKCMLQAGVSVNCSMGQPEGLPAGCTLLHVAANGTDKKLLDYLLNHGADVNARDSQGNSAMFYANRQSNKDSVRLLASWGGRLDASSRPLPDDGPLHSQSQLPLHHHHHHHLSLRRHQRSTWSTESDLPQRSKSAISVKHLPEIYCEDQPSKDHSVQSTRRGRPTNTSGTTKSRHPPDTSHKSSSNPQRHFLAVPPTKFFSSSPCLAQESPTTLPSSKLSSSLSSEDLTLSSLQTSPIVKVAKSKQSYNKQNNNSSTIRDLNNTLVLRQVKNSAYASAESLVHRKQSPVESLVSGLHSATLTLKNHSD